MLLAEKQGHGRMPDGVEGSGTKKEGKRGKRIWDGYWGLQQWQQFLWRVQPGLPVWQCVRSVNAGWTKDSGCHADRSRSERKGADHGETDQKRGTLEDA